MNSIIEAQIELKEQKYLLNYNEVSKYFYGLIDCNRKRPIKYNILIENPLNNK